MYMIAAFMLICVHSPLIVGLRPAPACPQLGGPHRLRAGGGGAAGQAGRGDGGAAEGHCQARPAERPPVREPHPGRRAAGGAARATAAGRLLPCDTHTRVHAGTHAQVHAHTSAHRLRCLVSLNVPVKETEHTRHEQTWPHHRLMCRTSQPGGGG